MTGPYSFGSAANLDIEVGGLNVVTQYDQFSVNQCLPLRGFTPRDR
ncbi:MAG TPA: hypothetical protein VGA37_01215 [Gemmatimonadales bacterium]